MKVDINVKVNDPGVISVGRALGMDPYVLIIPSEPTDTDFALDVEVGGGVGEDLAELADFLTMTADFIRQAIDGDVVTVAYGDEADDQDDEAGE